MIWLAIIATTAIVLWFAFGLFFIPTVKHRERRAVLKGTWAIITVIAILTPFVYLILKTVLRT